MNTTQEVNRTFTNNIEIHFTTNQSAQWSGKIVLLPKKKKKKKLDNFNQFRKEVEIDVVE
jgi:hypothetical protein